LGDAPKTKRPTLCEWAETFLVVFLFTEMPLATLVSGP
jgi:hypothetical protein